jgi:cellobiose-specific phosphotransferase system component IIA
VHLSILRAGYSSKDIAKALRQLRKDKHHRAVSVIQAGMIDFYEAKEMMTLGLKKLLCPKATKESSSLEEFHEYNQH